MTRPSRAAAALEVPCPSLCAVRFVTLIGEQGWPPVGPAAPAQPSASGALSKLLCEAAEPLADLQSGSIAALLDRIGDARLVLLGEATHGTSEFYRMRARSRAGSCFYRQIEVAVEGLPAGQAQRQDPTTSRTGKDECKANA